MSTYESFYLTELLYCQILGALKLRKTEVGALKMSTIEVGALKMSSIEVSALKASKYEVGAIKASITEVGDFPEFSKAIKRGNLVQFPS